MHAPGNKMAAGDRSRQAAVPIAWPSWSRSEVQVAAGLDRPGGRAATGRRRAGRARPREATLAGVGAV